MYQELELQSKIHHVEGDINKLSKIEEVVSKTKPDFIFHLAAQALVSVSYKKPIDTISTNVLVQPIF